MKKIISVILSLILALSCFGLPLSVFAYNEVPEIEGLNPYYDGAEVSDGTIESYITSPSTSKKHNGKTYYSDGKELYTFVKNKLIEGKNFTLYYLSKGTYYVTRSQYENLLYELFQFSTDDELSTGCFDGDYLRYNISIGINGGSLDTAKDGYYFYTLKMTTANYLSSSQQSKLNSAVNSFINSLKTESLSDYEIIKKIHDYICSKTTYDENAYATASRSSDRTAFTAYGALVSGKAVCQGYSNAFYRICKELGFSVRIIVSDPNIGNHAWNLVKLDDSYYYVDCTWDDQIKDDGSDTGDEYSFFLVNYKNIRKKDGSTRAHTIFNTYFDTEYFENTYGQYIANDNYNADDYSLLSRCVVSPSLKSAVYSGTAIKPVVTVKNANGEMLVNGADYSVSYSSNTNTGYAKININAIGAYNGKTHRLFKIVPSKADGITQSEVTNNSVKLKWKTNSGNVSGYSIERVKNGKWTVVKTVSSNSAELSGLASAANQYIRIRAYKDVSKNRMYGAYSKTYFFATKPSKVSIKPLKSGSKKITVRWKKVTRATGYEIQYSLNKSMKNAKTKKVSSKKLSNTISNLKKGKKYYIRIRAVRKYTNPSKKSKYSNGQWSSKKSVTVK